MPCSVTTTPTSLRWVDTTSTSGTMHDAPDEVVDRVATTEMPPTDRVAPALKSAWPPIAAIVRPPTRSRLTAPSRPTWSAPLHETKRSVADSRPTSWVTVADTRSSMPAAWSCSIGAPPHVYEAITGALSRPRSCIAAALSVNRPDHSLTGRSIDAAIASATTAEAELHGRVVGQERHDQLTDPVVDVVERARCRSRAAVARPGNRGDDVAIDTRPTQVGRRLVDLDDDSAGDSSEHVGPPHAPAEGITTVAADRGHHGDVGRLLLQQGRHGAQPDGEWRDPTLGHGGGDAVAGEHRATAQFWVVEPGMALGGPAEQHLERTVEPGRVHDVPWREPWRPRSVGVGDAHHRRHRRALRRGGRRRPALSRSSSGALR